MLIFPEAKLTTAGQFSEEGVLLPTELARQAAPSSVQPRPVLPVSRSRSRRQLFAPKQFNGAYLTTPEGWSLIIIGCGVGFLFAVVALCVSVVSFPCWASESV